MYKVQECWESYVARCTVAGAVEGLNEGQKPSVVTDWGDKVWLGLGFDSPRPTNFLLFNLDGEQRLNTEQRKQ